MYRRAYLFKLLPTHRLKAVDEVRFQAALLYNHCIALHKRYYRLCKGVIAKQKNADSTLKKSAFLGAYQLKQHLTRLKKRSVVAWGNLPSQTIQDVVERIDKGYALFFSERAKGNFKIQAPSFRKVKKYRSFTLKQAGWRLLDGQVLPGRSKTSCPRLVLNLRNGEGKLVEKAFKFRQSRLIEGVIKTVTLKRDQVGDWWVCFSCAKETPFSTNQRYVASGKTVGVDFGLKTFLTRSDEATHQAPQFFRRGLRKLRLANRKLARKKPDSNHRKQARQALAKLHRQIANQRSAYHWQVANELAQKFDVICLEDLNLTGLKARWGRKISDLAFGEFVHKLKLLCVKHSKHLVQIDRWFASSKLCSACGWKHETLGLRDRMWTCRGCGSMHDRDVNAAQNIHHEGLRLLANKQKTGADAAPVGKWQRKTRQARETVGDVQAALTPESPTL